MLRHSDYAQVLIRVLPGDVAPAATRLAQLRNAYEKQFAALVGALPLAGGADRKALRLMLIGALNWSRFWFSSPGRDTPRSLARKFVGFIRGGARWLTQASTSSSTYPPKVIITKIGFDGHDRGSRLVAAFLRDAGMEVIYTPPWQEVSTVVKLAIEEDAEVIGISSLATDHLLVPRLMTALREAGVDDVQVIVGGIVPARDEQLLLDAGVAHVFHPGTSLEQIAERSSRAFSARARDATQ